jgi:hypothetical protein
MDGEGHYVWGDGREYYGKIKIFISSKSQGRIKMIKSMDLVITNGPMEEGI